MHLEFRLRQLLAGSGQDTYGKFMRIEKATGISRKVVQAIYENRRRSVSLDVIEHLCDHLARTGVREPLPAALFGARPSGLIEALAAAARVRVCIGGARERSRREVRPMWLAHPDAEVASVLVELLSSARRPEDRPPGSPRIEHLYVPSRLTPFGEGDDDGQDARGSAIEAQQMFERLRGDSAGSATIMIGSQIANSLVELFVADLFACRPFSSQGAHVPFFLLHKRPAGAPPTPSCFGGPRAPGEWSGRDDQGVYYRGATGEWNLCPTSADRDAGIVVVRRDPGADGTELAVLGHSGRATRCLGEVLRHRSDAFWDDMDPRPGGILASAYACALDLEAGRRGDDSVLRDFTIHRIALR
jgi:hypothetical protein